MKAWRTLIFFGFSLLCFCFTCKNNSGPEVPDFRDDLIGAFQGKALTHKWNSQFGNSDSVSWDTTLFVFKVDTSESYIEIYGRILRPVDYANYDHFFVEAEFIGNGNEATAGFWGQDSILFEFSSGGLGFKSHYKFIGAKFE